MVEYKDIEGYPGYKIGSDGTILSNKRGKGYINSFISASGYKQVVLYKDNQRKNFQLHRLLAEAFIPNPNNLPWVNHKDENKLNNDLSNLEWCSKSYNRIYGTCEERRKNTMASVYAVAQYDLEGHLLNVFLNCREAARFLNLEENASFNIGQCALGHRKISYGYIWKKINNNEINTDKTNGSLYNVMKNLYNDLMPIFGVYKETIEKELSALKQKNKEWKLAHSGEDNENYHLKMCALAALPNALDIINMLYVENET